MPNPSYFIEHTESDVGTTCLGVTKDTHGGIVSWYCTVKAETIDKCSFTILQVTDEETQTVFLSLYMSGNEPFKDPP